jgi:hypothetical protein
MLMILLKHRYLDLLLSMLQERTGIRMARLQLFSRDAK